MARTPLLRALQRLASEHAEASARGIPVEEVRKLRNAEISRRDFLKGAPASRSPGHWPVERSPPMQLPLRASRLSAAVSLALWRR